MDEPLPVVTGVVVRGRKGVPAVIDWGAVRAADDDAELSLNVGTDQLAEYPRATEEVWLARVILDKQVVDTDGRRVVRINDLQLQHKDGQLLLVGVDIGARGVLRRLGLERAGRRVTRMVGRDFPQRLISWDAIDPVQSDERSIKLRISHK